MFARGTAVFYGAAALVALAVGAAVPLILESDAARSVHLPAVVWWSLLTIAASLYFLGRLGLRVRGVLGSLFLTQAVYLALGYLARPLVLLWVEPVSRKGDPIADVRMASAGYEFALGEILPIIAFGTAVFVSAAWLACRLPAARAPQTLPGVIRPQHAAFLIVLGWGFRIVQATATPSTLIETGAILASLGVGVVVLFAPTPPRSLVLLGLVASELTWSAIDASKTPILALMLWLLIRHFRDGGKLSPRVVLTGTLGGLAAFQTITFVKVQVGLLSSTDVVRSYYPEPVQPFFAILARFDALQSGADAYFAGPGAWLTPSQAATQMALSLLPRQLLSGQKADLAGVAWGTQVRSQSLPGDPGASLAQGPAAEGWVLGGYAGVAVEVLIMAALTLLVARWLQSQTLFWMLLGVAMTSNPFLFERAVIGTFEGLGKGIQVALAGALIISVLRALDRKHVPRSTLGDRHPGARDADVERRAGSAVRA